MTGDEIVTWSDVFEEIGRGLVEGAVLGVGIVAGAAVVIAAAYVAIGVLRAIWAVLWRVLVAVALVAGFAWRHLFPPPPPPPRCTAHGWLACPRDECREEMAR